MHMNLVGGTWISGSCKVVNGCVVSVDNDSPSENNPFLLRFPWLGPEPIVQIPSHKPAPEARRDQRRSPTTRAANRKVIMSAAYKEGCRLAERSTDPVIVEAGLLYS
jgi:hypothetical protein